VRALLLESGLLLMSPSACAAPPGCATAYTNTAGAERTTPADNINTAQLGCNGIDVVCSSLWRCKESRAQHIDMSAVGTCVMVLLLLLLSLLLLHSVHNKLTAAAPGP
jgi:hypothetical protein